MTLGLKTSCSYPNNFSVFYCNVYLGRPVFLFVLVLIGTYVSSQINIFLDIFSNKPSLQKKGEILSQDWVLSGRVVWTSGTVYLGRGPLNGGQ